MTLKQIDFLSKSLPVCICLLICGICMAQNKAPDSPPLVHPKMNTTVTSADGKLTLRLVGRKQNYTGREKRTRDVDIHSPKSINVHPSGKKFYVNSLEGASTVVYALGDTSRKLAVIKHKFTDADSHLWAKPSGLFKFRHYTKNLNTFQGKPVESTFSHGGRYLWVPYYRRSYDINAQDPSAVAIIDTRTDKIVKMMEAGVLPKMIATSPDGKYVAVTHWGDNTVGLIDISSPDPNAWRYVALIPIDKQLFWNLSLTEPVNRDSNSGNALRGTVFTPDGKYLLVGCMGGNGGMGVIDLASRKYIGKLYGMMPNMRHLVINNGYLYLSINTSGYVQRVPLKNVYEAISCIQKGKGTISGWQNVKVGSGARTIELSPDGRYLFAACNIASKIYAVDTNTMQVVLTIDADSYPVGLDISRDGTLLFTTSQGRKNGGGNAVDIYEITRR